MSEEKVKSKDYDIIIGMPVKNDLKSLIKAVESIVHTTRHDFKFVIVEADSTDGAYEYVSVLPYLYNWVNWEIIHAHTKSPLEAYNMLFEKAKQEQKDLYLVQTDVMHFRLYKRDWLYEMHEIAKNEDCGAIGPLGALGEAGDEALPALICRLASL